MYFSTTAMYIYAYYEYIKDVFIIYKTSIFNILKITYVVLIIQTKSTFILLIKHIFSTYNIMYPKYTNIFSVVPL